MDVLSLLNPLSWPSGPVTEQPAYHAGNALGWLYQTNKQASTNHALTGRLYVSKSGWLLLSVPNALVRGLYDALMAPGAELPRAGTLNVPNVASDTLNAHISVMTADEVKQIGADKINERGHTASYSLGQLKEITPRNIDGVSKVWALQITSPMLAAIRKSYGLSPFLNDHPFHITVAVRRKKVLQDNNVSKAAAENKSDNIDCNQLIAGVQHEHKHAADDQNAEEVAEDHLHSAAQPDKNLEQVTPRIIDDLRRAKEHSDNKRYLQKTDILRRLMNNAPEDWVIDDSSTYHKGITHTPTKFKFHIHPSAIPSSVKAATEKSGSVYLNALRNSFGAHQPVVYNSRQSFLENIQNHLYQVKQRGDFVRTARRNYENYQAAHNSRYKYQQALKALKNQRTNDDVLDDVLEDYGQPLIDSLNIFKGKK